MDRTLPAWPKTTEVFRNPALCRLLGARLRSSEVSRDFAPRGLRGSLETADNCCR